MAVERHELWQLADAIQMDLRSATAKLTELRAHMAALDLNDRRPACPACGYRAAMNLPSVAEHVAQHHPGLATSL